MFETISIVVVRLRQQRTIQTLATIECLLPFLAVRNDASPHGWSQIWSHLLANAANHSRISSSKAPRGLPWAQGVAGSNPVAPTTFRICRSHIGHTLSRRFALAPRRSSATIKIVVRRCCQISPVGSHSFSPDREPFQLRRSYRSPVLFLS